MHTSAIADPSPTVSGSSAGHVQMKPAPMAAGRVILRRGVPPAVGMVVQPVTSVDALAGAPGCLFWPAKFPVGVTDTTVALTKDNLVDVAAWRVTPISLTFILSVAGHLIAQMGVAAAATITEVALDSNLMRHSLTPAYT